ncbi:MAG: DUF805 domain-containing protein, partial [Rhizobiaceae bacterium]|nr:DUF805 domain-containing protein [Rhizobiaceae bacterium]
MIGNLFCFSGRIGRLRFFLWSVVFVPVAFFLMLLFLTLLFALGFHFDGSKTTALMILLPVLAVFFWTQLSLQVARIRDIGWKPLIIITALLLIDVADVIV